MHIRCVPYNFDNPIIACKENTTGKGDTVQVRWMPDIRYWMPLVCNIYYLESSIQHLANLIRAATFSSRLPKTSQAQYQLADVLTNQGWIQADRCIHRRQLLHTEQYGSGYE